MGIGTLTEAMVSVPICAFMLEGGGSGLVSPLAEEKLTLRHYIWTDSRGGSRNFSKGVGVGWTWPKRQIFANF